MVHIVVAPELIDSNLVLPSTDFHEKTRPSPTLLLTEAVITHVDKDSDFRLVQDSMALVTYTHLMGYTTGALKRH